jgi:hypothetical protein
MIHLEENVVNGIQSCHTWLEHSHVSKRQKVERQLVGCQSNWGINSLALSADFQTIRVLVDPLQSFRKLRYPIR